MNKKTIAGYGMTSKRTRDRMVKRLRLQGITHPGVLDALRDIPRHIFVDEALGSHAYDDTALPISFQQTISQPYIVARMTELLLEAGRLENVLEIGTGSGFQAAVLARLARQVYSVERIEGLIKYARARLMALAIRNVRLKHADGQFGWPEYAPFDGVLVTAAPELIPPGLIDQLRIGGRLVIPVGGAEGQELHVVTRTEAGVELNVIEPVSFVPLHVGYVGG